MANLNNDSQLTNNTESSLKQTHWCCKDEEEGLVVFFHVIKFIKSLYIWVGDVEKSLNHMSIAMPTLQQSHPSSSLLYGDNSQTFCEALSRKVASKTHGLVYVSSGLREDNYKLLVFAEVG